MVVKPLNANHGRGVSLNLTDTEHVRRAYAQAREHSRGIIVESFLKGHDHRMLVVNGELIAVAKRRSEAVGRFTEQLLAGTFPWAKLRQAQKL